MPHILNGNVSRPLSLAGLMLLGALSSGCTDNNVSLFIRHVIVPDETDSCSVSSEAADSVALFGGLMDKGITSNYSQTVLVGNQLVPRGDSDTLRPESSRVTFYQGETEIFNFAGTKLNEFSFPTTGFVDPASGTDPSFGVVPVTMIDAGTASLVNTPDGGGETVVVRLKLLGTTTGGIEVETGFWDFPVFVCESYAGGSNCLGCDPIPLDEDIVLPCRPGQDFAYDSRLALGTDGNGNPVNYCP